MEQKTITKIDALPQLKKRTRVAAYARVSSGKDAMLHSLAAQISYYNKLIQNHEGWEFVGVYADEAITGTKDARTEFQRLIKDAKDGKIDLIIVKAISRFARNTLTLLETIRKLKSINVDVYFEEQNLHSLSPEGEMVLTFLASFAQEEARSVSENMKWSIKKSFEKGVIWGGKSMYGYQLINKRLIIVPEQVEVVKRVFKMYIEGCGMQMIANIFHKEKVPKLIKGTWTKETVRNILTNYNYTGGLILQKTYRESYLTKKTKINKGELNQYIVDNDHERVVSMEDFMLVQKLRKERREFYSKSEPQAFEHPYTSLIQCGICKANYGRKTTRIRKIWTCTTYNSRGKVYCSSKSIPEEILNLLTKEVLGVDEISVEIVKEHIDYIEVFNGNILVYHLKEGSKIKKEWKDISRASSWTDEMKEKARIRAYAQHKKERNENGKGKNNPFNN